jgi:hypothetical protein
MRKSSKDAQTFSVQNEKLSHCRLFSVLEQVPVRTFIIDENILGISSCVFLDSYSVLLYYVYFPVFFYTAVFLLQIYVHKSIQHVLII